MPGRIPDIMSKWDGFREGALVAIVDTCPSGTPAVGCAPVVLTCHSSPQLDNWTRAAVAALAAPSAAADVLGSSSAPCVAIPTQDVFLVLPSATRNEGSSWLRRVFPRLYPCCYYLLLFLFGFTSKHSGPSKQSVRGRKKFNKTQKHKSTSRVVGPCRWVARRRFRVKPLKHMRRGQIKRVCLLRALTHARFSRQQHVYKPKPVQGHMPWFTKVVNWVCGWLGIRVGEASHPGPGGSRATKRKAEAFNADEVDQGLAQALLQTLTSYQALPKHAQTVQPPPNKKGKGGPPPRQQGSNLARILLQTLQSAMTQGLSDDVVATRVVNKLQRHAPAKEEHATVVVPRYNKPPTKQQVGEMLYEKIEFWYPGQGGKITGMILEMPMAELRPLLESDDLLWDKVAEAKQALQQHNPGTWADKVRGPRTKGQFEAGPRKSKGTGKGKTTLSNPQNSRFATQICPAEWTGEAVLTTMPQVEKALAEGTPPPGNLIITKDQTVSTALVSLWNAYNLNDTYKMTVATVKAEQGTGPCVSVCWAQGKMAQTHSQRLQVALTKVGNLEGPKQSTPVVTNIPKPVGEKLVTVRLLAPAFYRQYAPGVTKEDTPMTVISTWATNVGCQAALLTGGNWQVVQHAHGRILIGHLRVSPELAKKLVAASGRHALFATLVDKTAEKKPVWWVPRAKLDQENYFRQCLTEAQAQKISLALRQGGGSDIGLVGASADACSKRTRSWEFFGVPRHWEAADVSGFLTTNNWKDVTVKNKFKRGKQFIWLFQASSQENQTDQTKDFFHYTNADATLHFSIGVPKPRTKKAPVTERLPGPRKRWVDQSTHKGGNSSSPVIQVDAEDVEAEARPPATEEKERSPRRQAKNSTSDSQAKTVEPKELDPEKVFKTQFPDREIINCGGNGDCHFRAVAHSLAADQGKALSGDSLVREASKLRFLAVGHVMKHRDDFEPHWAHDPNEPDFMRAYQNPPDSFSDYLMLASLQGFYADHLLIQALATRLGVPIVVFAWNNKTWQRTVFAPGFRNGFATTTGKNLKPVVLTLQDNHFKVVRSIRSDDPAPEAWLRETAWCKKEFLRGGGPKSVLSLPQSTPAKASGGKRRAPRSLSLPSATPNKRSVASMRSSGRSLALPAATPPKPEAAPSRATSRFALSLPASRTPRASSHKRHKLFLRSSLPCPKGFVLLRSVSGLISPKVLLPRLGLLTLLMKVPNPVKLPLLLKSFRVLGMVKFSSGGLVNFAATRFSITRIFPMLGLMFLKRTIYLLYTNRPPQRYTNKLRTHCQRVMLSKRPLRQWGLSVPVTLFRRKVGMTCTKLSLSKSLFHKDRSGSVKHVTKFFNGGMFRIKAARPRAILNFEQSCPRSRERLDGKLGGTRLRKNSNNKMRSASHKSKPFSGFKNNTDCMKANLWWCRHPFTDWPWSLLRRRRLLQFGGLVSFVTSILPMVTNILMLADCIIWKGLINIRRILAGLATRTQQEPWLWILRSLKDGVSSSKSSKRSVGLVLMTSTRSRPQSRSLTIKTVKPTVSHFFVVRPASICFLRTLLLLQFVLLRTGKPLHCRFGKDFGKSVVTWPPKRSRSGRGLRSSVPAKPELRKRNTWLLRLVPVPVSGQNGSFQKNLQEPQLLVEALEPRESAKRVTLAQVGMRRSGSCVTTWVLFIVTLNF